MNTEISQKFSKIYKADAWSNGSGPGSFSRLNHELFDFIRKFIARNNVSSMVDIGCGDFQLWRRFDFAECSYTGFDVVDSVVQKNARFARSHIKFERMPDNLGDLPFADLYFIKDVLIHLNNDEAARLVAIARARSKFSIFVNNTAAGNSNYNSEIQIGQFRPVDVSLQPFEAPVIESKVYGAAWAPDPRWPEPLARLLRRRVWPGEKHIQVVAGECR